MGDEKKVDLKLSSLSRFGVRGRGGARGNSGAAASRLPSLKPTRDLTLGGTPKRTFTPNIVGRSTKKEEGDDRAGPSHDRRGRGRGRARGRGRGRGGGRGRGDIIQSSGVFSQGIFGRETLAGALSGSYGGRGGTGGVSKNEVDDGEEAVSKTSYIKNMRGEEEADSDKIFEMLNDEGKIEIDDEDLKAGGLMPITLPLASKLSHKIKTDGDIKSEVESQVEDSDDDNMDEDNIKKPDDDVSPMKKPVNKTAATEPQPTLEINDIFKKEGMEEGALFFLQLPDALPINYLAQDVDEDVKPDIAGASSASKQISYEEEDIEEKLKKFSFNNVSEGYIGKLQIHKSGKVRMRLGNMSLDLSLGTPCGFLQDLVSVNTDKKPGDMVCLGHIDNRIIAVPDYHCLLGSMQ